MCVVCCVLSACCLWFGVSRLVCCLLKLVCSLLFAGCCCLMCVVCRLLNVGCCVQFGVSCLLVIGRGLLLAVWYGSLLVIGGLFRALCCLLLCCVVFVAYWVLFACLKFVVRCVLIIC